MGCLHSKGLRNFSGILQRVDLVLSTMASAEIGVVETDSVSLGIIAVSTMKVRKEARRMDHR